MQDWAKFPLPPEVRGILARAIQQTRLPADKQNQYKDFTTLADIKKALEKSTGIEQHALQHVYNLALIGLNQMLEGFPEHLEFLEWMPPMSAATVLAYNRLTCEVPPRKALVKIQDAR